MIKKEELGAAGGRKNLSVQNAEKDYLLELLLYSIYTQFGDLLVLKGGTALYKFFSLNRFSEDLDFVLSKKKISEQDFIKRVMKTLSLLDVKGRVKEISRYRNEINLRLYFKGPLYDGSKESAAFVSINISLRERPLNFSSDLLVPSYREIPAFDVFVMSPEEIFAEKIRAILTRNKPRDLYDAWFLTKRGVRPDMKLINKKLKLYGKKFLPAELAAKSNDLKRFWETDLRGLIVGDLPSFEKTREELIRAF